MRLTPEQIADVRERADCADLAASLGARLRRRGAKSIGSCPICGGGPKATRFEATREKWVCAVCPDGGDALALVMKATGRDFAGAIEYLGGARALDPAEQTRLRVRREREEIERAKTAAAHRERERAAAQAIWQSGQRPVLEGPVWTYLVGRGLSLPVTALIREHLDVPYFHGEEEDERGRKWPRVIHRGPAMLAALIDDAGQVTGCHITWLSRATFAKADIICPETGEVLPAKKMRGLKRATHIRLREPQDGFDRLIIGEGIETTLSVAAALHRAGSLRARDAFWAAGDLGNMAGRALESVRHPTALTDKGRPVRVPGPVPDPEDATFTVPASVTHLLLLGDGDSEPFMTKNAMERARARHARPGLHVGVLMAPEGRDFNNVLRGQM